VKLTTTDVSPAVTVRELGGEAELPPPQLPRKRASRSAITAEKSFSNRVYPVNSVNKTNEHFPILLDLCVSNTISVTPLRGNPSYLKHPNL